VADFNQFGSVKPGASGDPQHCAQCETMLADALDGTLSPADQATFDLHMVGCPSCSALLADAQRGAAWMEMLHSPRPEPPANLLERIIAQTSGQAELEASRAANSKTYPVVLGSTDRLRPRTPNTLLGHPVLVPASNVPAAAFTPSNVLPFRARVTYGLRSLGHTMLQPRLAMTAAMAFFSIALTLNLTGVRLSQLRASDLKPSSIMRSCYEAKAKVVRYSDNLRVVYELESRVRDLQHSSDNDGSTNTPAPQSAPAAKPGQKPAGNQQQPDGQKPDQKQNRPRPNPGSSQRETPGGTIRQVGSSHRLYSLPAATEAFVVLNLSMHKQEGGLV
jgi:Putative zinc-finger